MPHYVTVVRDWQVESAEDRKKERKGWWCEILALLVSRYAWSGRALLSTPGYKLGEEALRETNLELTKDHNQLEAFLSLISENVLKMNNTYILNSTS